MSSDSEKPPGKLTSPPAYNQRDVLGLKPISEWRALEAEVHMKHNRVMQPGFMYRDASNVLGDAKLTGEECLTDVCCPTVKSELFLHLAKDMVVRYKVHVEELSKNANKALEYLFDNNRALFDKIQSNVQTKLNDISNENIRALALARLAKNKITEPSGEQIELFELKVLMIR